MPEVDRDDNGGLRDLELTLRLNCNLLLLDMLRVFHVWLAVACKFAIFRFPLANPSPATTVVRIARWIP